MNLNSSERNLIETFLKASSYYTGTWKDEMQAYIVTGEEHEGYDFSKASIHKELSALYEKYKKRGLKR